MKDNSLIIFLDMDGVVTFWVKAAAEAIGIDMNNKEIRDFLKKDSNAMDRLAGGPSNLWRDIDKLGTKFWSELEILPWSFYLHKELKKRTKDVCFLTSPSKNPICAFGKIEWLKKYFGDNFKDFLIGSSKHLCAQKRSLLIDDTPKKVNKFIEYGGNAFLWPNPIQLLDGDVSLEKTMEELLRYIDQCEKKL